MPMLVVQNGPRAGAQLPIFGDRFVITRETIASVNDGRHDGVSRHHASLTRVGDDWQLADGDGRGKPSLNGTFLNGQRIASPQALADQDRIRICAVKFLYREDAADAFNPEASVTHADSGSCLDTQPAERLRVLLEISEVLRGALDAAHVVERTLEKLLALFPRAERAFVVFREGPNSPLEVRAIRGPRAGPADPRYSATVIRQCLGDAKALLGNDLAKQFPDSDSIGVLPVRSLMCAPLWSPDGKAMGAVQLDAPADGRKFTEEDLRLLVGVACQASIALTNARQHRELLASQKRLRNMEVAQQVQRALLPAKVPTVPGYAFHAHYAAAEEVSGDFYDFVGLPGGRWAVLLGDVAGHGVPAALLMARFGAEARACLEANPDDLPAAVACMSAMVDRANVEGRFVTLVAMVIDPAAHTAAVVSAGHPSPLVRRANRTVEAVVSDDERGPPLGADPSPKYGCASVALGPGDMLVLYSDGVTDAADAADRLFAVDGVRAVLAATPGLPKAAIDALASAVRRHAAGDPGDDVTLVCVGRTA